MSKIKSKNDAKRFASVLIAHIDRNPVHFNTEQKDPSVTIDRNERGKLYVKMIKNGTTFTSTFENKNDELNVLTEYVFGERKFFNSFDPIF